MLSQQKQRNGNRSLPKLFYRVVVATLVACQKAETTEVVTTDREIDSRQSKRSPLTGTSTRERHISLLLREGKKNGSFLQLLTLCSILDLWQLDPAT